MRKSNLILIVALAAALVAGVAWSQVTTVSAQEVPPVGIVVAYIPGQSITIVDQHGDQHEYVFAPSMKILPPGHEAELMVGSFVTIIAPDSFHDDHHTAVGIVIHPHVPEGWHVPTTSVTAPVTETAVGTVSVTETATATETPTALATDTATSTATPTVEATSTDTATATSTPSAGGTSASTVTFIEWLRSLFHEILTSH